MRTRTGIVGVACFVAVLLSVVGPAQAATSWTVLRSPNVGPLSNGLGAVAALTGSEAWAVGTRQVEGVDFRTLAEHWNGSRWTVIPTLDGGTLDRLNGVAELATDDVWAVGNDYDSSVPAYRTLAEHFDGTTWSIVASPNGGTRYDALQAVAAIASNDVWAVGVTQTSGATIRNLTLIEHFDGAAWSIVPSPNPPNETDAWLLGVTAVSADDVWAVGFDHLGTLAEHWDGFSWTIVPTQNAVSGSNELASVTALATGEVWAVGNSQSASGPARTLIERWDGSAWTIVPSPNRGIQNNMLFGVTALSASDVWTVGVWVKPLPEGGFVNQTLSERWNGSSWAVVQTPNPALNDVLLGAASVGPSTVFAVGGATNTSQRTLVLEDVTG